MRAVDLSVVVAIRNQRPHNELFLEALRAYSAARTELIIVDNGSTDGSPDVYRRAGARVIPSGGNLCYPEAMNLGLAEARGEYVGFLNNDIVTSPGWDAELIGALDRHRLPAVSPVGIERMPTRELTRAVQERWRLVKRRIGPVHTLEDLRAAVETMYGDWPAFCQQVKAAFRDRLVSGIVGSCVVTRRSFMQALGGWDIRVQAADWDLYLRLFERAERLKDIGLPMVAGWVYVHHYVQATRRGERTPFTCSHPTLDVQEKWGQASIRRWFFDAHILAERPRLLHAPGSYLRFRLKRVTVDSLRGIMFLKILFRGLPGVEELLTQVQREAAQS